nr:transposase family protein [Tautonia marina]
MPSDQPTTFHDHFRDLTDPWVEWTRKHPLINIAFIAVCGVLSGANSFATIHESASIAGPGWPASSTSTAASPPRAPSAACWPGSIRRPSRRPS